MEVVALALTSDVSLMLVNENDGLGWRFSHWQHRALTLIDLQPTAEDRQRRFGDAASAAEYFRTRYASRLRPR
jgi:hypothetical protein